MWYLFTDRQQFKGTEKGILKQVLYVIIMTMMDNILCELTVLSTLHVLTQLILITALKVDNIFILILQMRKAEVPKGQGNLFPFPHTVASQ